MKKPMVFYKMEASGNDFVVVDNRKKAVRDVVKFTRAICDRHKGVGADGVLFIESSRKADFKMRIVNADGSEAEMCGNGSRCVALYAHEVMKLPSKFLMETLAGLIGADVKKQTVRVKLSDPKDFKPRGLLNADGTDWQYYSVNTGVPHAVIFVEDIANFPVQNIGEKIRYHDHFKPAGTNVNFVQLQEGNQIRVRTYERGVENETLACGTGVVASAIIAHLFHRVPAPVRAQVQGGDTLEVSFSAQDGRIEDVHLKGPADFVFEGKLTLPKKFRLS